MKCINCNGELPIDAMFCPRCGAPVPMQVNTPEQPEPEDELTQTAPQPEPAPVPQPEPAPVPQPEPAPVPQPEPIPAPEQTIIQPQGGVIPPPIPPVGLPGQQPQQAPQQYNAPHQQQPYQAQPTTLISSLISRRNQANGCYG